MRYRLRTEQLQRILADSRLSQNHWAIRLGFSRGHWSDIVNGKHPFPSTKTRERLVEALGVPFETLFEPYVAAAPSADVEFRVALSDRYIIDRELGQGAMGTVYLARDVAHGRLVAIKQMSREAVCGVGLTAFMREISVVARLQHPNILPLFAAGTAADHPYFVMPWVRGGSLRDKLTSDLRLPLENVRRIVDGMSSALTYAHGEHVLHCDIKPENILLHGDHAWLTDFGISRILHAEASEWRARSSIDISAGTPAYVSPEQANGEQELDGRADVYSLGCVVYELLAGRPPFEGSTTEAVVAKRFVSAPPPLTDFAPELSDAVVQVVARAMEVRREDRWQTATAFSEALHAASSTRTASQRALSSASLAFSRLTGTLRRSMGKSPAYAYAERFSTLLSDMKSAWRQAVSAPALTAVIVLTLAVAIGLTTSAYTLIDHVLLRSLVFPEPDRLVSLASVDSAGGTVDNVSSANWLDWRNNSTTLEHSAIFGEQRVSLRDGDAAERLPGATVSSDFFQSVRPRFIVGRSFTPEEVEQGGIVVVSEGLWRRLLAADTSLNTPLRGMSRDLRVVGVVAHGFEYPVGTDVWVGMRTPPEPPGTRNNINWTSIARLKPGVTIAQATADLARVSSHIREIDRDAWYAYGVKVVPLQTIIVGDARGYLLMLLGAVVLVLLIACMNVAAANIGRGLARSREFAVRSAIGARSSRIFGQLLTEHVTIAMVGGVLGVLFAWVAVHGVVAAWGNEIPRSSELRLDTRVLAVAAAVTMLAGVLSGLWPAILASATPASGLVGAGSRGTARGGRNAPGAVLVSVQIALAMVLVCGSTLFIRSFQALLSRDLGFDVNVATVEATLNASTFRDTTQEFVFWRELRSKLHAIPGVTHVGLANWTPLASAGTGSIETAERPGVTLTTSFRVISDDYLEALGVHLLEGRAIVATDDASAEKVVVINRRVASHFWPGQSALGKIVRAPTMERNSDGSAAPWRRVVGVVNDVRHWGFESDADAEMYVPFQQVPMWRIATMTAIVSGRGVADGQLPAITSTARHVSPDVAMEVGTLRARAQTLTATRRMVVTILSAFGVMALVLATLGTYGLLTYAVAQRSREMAIRSALGATRPQLMSLVFSGVGRIVMAGMAIGVAAAIGLSRLIASQLVDTSPTDRAAFAASIVAVLITALLATWVPARRAGRADPSDTLRGD